MSDSGGGDNSPKTVSCSLGTEFDLEPGAKEDVCVDLDGEWREDSAVTRHQDLDIPGLELVSGSVGEGGDHVNITFKNCSEGKITIDKDRVAITITEPGKGAQSGDKDQTVNEDPEAEDNKMDTEDSADRGKDKQETVSDGLTSEAGDRAQEETSGEVMEIDGTSELPSAENSEGTLSSENKANDSAFDNLFQDYNKQPAEPAKVTDTTDDAPETAEMEKKCNEEKKADGEKKLSSPILKMSFVDESVATDQEKNGAGMENVEKDKEESGKMDINSETVDQKEGEPEKKNDTSGGKDENSEEKKDDTSEEKKSSETEKPTLKLASFSTMSTSTENGHSEENEDGCYSCSKLITNLFEAIVWETMQFCDEVINIIKLVFTNWTQLKNNPGWLVVWWCRLKVKDVF